MKLQFPLIALLALSLTSCGDAGDGTATATDTAILAPSADATVNTTTSSSTVSTFQPRADVQYMDLRSRKLVRLRVDTIKHYVVNSETNEPIDWFIEPGTTDTFYGRNMQMANGHIRYGSGNDWIYEEQPSAAGDMTGTSGANVSSSSGTGIEKIKTDGDETKIKMQDGTKIKTEDGETKVKSR